MGVLTKNLGIGNFTYPPGIGLKRTKFFPPASKIYFTNAVLISVSVREKNKLKYFADSANLKKIFPL